jgi:hypothetical protein
MKKIYNLLVLLLVGLASFAQPYYVYTATKSGLWNDVTVWNITLRSDGIPKNKVVIPGPYTITANNGVNGAGLGNVEIEVSGRIQMAANTTINFSNNSSIRLVGAGNINGTSNNQRLVIGGVVKYNGSLDGLKTGANTIADNTSGASPNGFRMMGILPVTFANFYVSRVDADVMVRWTTATESNNHHFEVQRSEDGQSWKTIAIVSAAGNSTELNSYSYTDKNMLKSIAYYRIMQVDFDGRFSYTVVRAVKNSTENAEPKIFITKNGMLTVLFEEIKSQVSVDVYNASGQSVIHRRYEQSAYITLQSLNMASGVYVVRIIDENNEVATKKIFVE